MNTVNPKTTKYIIANLSEVVTLEPLVKAQRFTQIAMPDLGRIKSPWIAVADGKIAAVGSGSIPVDFQHQ